MNKQTGEINKLVNKTISEIVIKFRNECKKRSIPEETIANIIRGLEEKYKPGMRLLTIPSVSTSKKVSKAPAKNDGIVWKKLKGTDLSFTTDIKFSSTRGYIKDTANKIIAGLDKNGCAVALSEDDVRYLMAQCLSVEPLTA